MRDRYVVLIFIGGIALIGLLTQLSLQSWENTSKLLNKPTFETATLDIKRDGSSVVGRLTTINFIPTRVDCFSETNDIYGNVTAEWLIPTQWNKTLWDIWVVDAAINSNETAIVCIVQNNATGSVIGMKSKYVSENKINLI